MTVPFDPQQLAMEQPAAAPSKGVSLGRDAWRRLRRSRMAMFSLTTLITIAALAFLTPLLPLAAKNDYPSGILLRFCADHARRCGPTSVPLCLCAVPTATVF